MWRKFDWNVLEWKRVGDFFHDSGNLALNLEYVLKLANVDFYFSSVVENFIFEKVV